jgi:formylglycine-generating enzyme required for sulfatase activity
MEFVLIQPGTFLMGSPESEEGRHHDEILHEVTLTKPYYLQTTPVTQEQWQAVMGDNPSYFQGAHLPVERVSWDDVQQFIQRLNQRSEGTYRLPTEAEWEYAARAGTSTPFGIGNGVDIDSTQANFNGKYPYGKNKQGVYRERTTPVKSFAPNGWGLYDMHGNVCEWVQDWFGEYPEGEETDPQGTQLGCIRVSRGGGWYSYARNARSAIRYLNSPGIRGYYIGFRLVKEYKETISEIELLKSEIAKLKERLSAVEVKL